MSFFKIARRLTLSNVVVAVALSLAVGGGTAAASYVLTSNSQLGPNTVSGHNPPTGYHANVVAGSLNGTDLAANAIPADEHCVTLFGVRSCVGSTKIADGAVSSSEIAGGAVGNGQLAANAVTGNKVADGSLTGADLAAKSLTSQQINEQSLAQGQAYSAYHDAEIFIPNNTTVSVLSLSLPAGTYLVLGKGIVENLGGNRVLCTTYGGGTSDPTDVYSDSGSDWESTLTSTTVASGSSPFSIKLDCYGDQADGRISYAKLTAVSLASNHVSAQ